MNIIYRLVMTVAAAGLALSLQAQETEIVYKDANAFPLFGKAIENTSARYERLPGALEGKIRNDLWNLGRHSAGLYIRFRSNSKSIYTRWESTFCMAMNHMTQTGIRGLDLYTLDNGEWRFCGSSRPQTKAENTTKVVANLDGQMREYMLYLSLYDGVKSLEIGTEKGSVLEGPAVDSPRSDKKIVMYGTSILQGGCANRPGMAFTGIIGRWLDREVVNLGFSGNAHLDPEIAELMIQVDNPGVFVLDYVPNCTAERINEKGERFFRIIRDAHPDVPVIFVENPVYTNSPYDQQIKERMDASNAAQLALYTKLKKAGEKKLFYIPCDDLIGHDGEATIDGTHFTDLGMVRYAEEVTPVIKKALKKSR